MPLGTRSVLTLLTTAATAAALVTPVGPAGAASAASAVSDLPDPPAAPPASIALPDGFQPEGIAIEGHVGYFGSRADGDLYRADLRTGKGRRISQGPGTPSLGLKVGPERRLYVAGGSAGDVRIVSARTGKVLRSFQVNPDTSLVNDVVITRRAAWFTDSLAAQIYRVPIRRDGRLPGKDDVRTIALKGDWEQPAAGELGANGITNANAGRGLFIVNSTDGTLFRVSRSGRRAGRAQEVRLGGASLTSGDGMLLEGDTLLVVRNRLNRVVALRVNALGDRARRVRSFTAPGFDVPTTIARWRGAVYLPNARFTTPPTPETTYDVTRVARHPRR